MQDYADIETMDIEEMIELAQDNEMWGYVSDADLQEYLFDNAESIAAGEDVE